MSSIVQNDTSPIDFFMADDADPTGETGKAGLVAADITFKLAKTGGNFAAGGGTIAAITNGRDGAFRYTPVTADVATLGDVWLEASAAGCFTWADIRRVVQAGAAASDWTPTRAAKIDTIDTRLPSDPADASVIATATDAILTAIGNIAAGSGLDAAGVRAALGLAAANLDTQLASLDVNVAKVNDVTVGGSGTLLDPWGPA